MIRNWRTCEYLDIENGAPGAIRKKLQWASELALQKERVFYLVTHPGAAAT